ncbi:L-cysteine desulfidase family protein [Celerinatantimonas diazotrophica]|uniref:UPF0597 protein EV690_2954 n=1 Tax=Celerinatantimonas diazotrophica TaxID=412034 RepID=A0A4R1J9H0_9GAMM|nr:L-serine ammonia-lyase, iron-sulfur-dependent, subunit alpha [Celerinatantimonas diazotrophica]TCK47246.1 L-cysteine desulfidase [Celerinatantimonas diazotrophica]CAG9296018.1 hypothetical protein CEDIAZO_01157 [Celerinatantimonas diazotrophica]
MSSESLFLNALKQSLKPALGCTEPLTVALAGAWARYYSCGELKNMDVKVSANLYKNAAGVFVPGTGMTGLAIAAAAGWWGGDPKQGLQVLGSLNKASLAKAKRTLSRQPIQVNYVEHPDVFYTHLNAHTDSDHISVLMGQSHDGLLQVTVNSEVCYQQNVGESLPSSPATLDKAWSVAAIVRFVEQVELHKLTFIEQSATLNVALSELGERESMGLAIGAQLRHQQRSGYISDDLSTEAMILSASASDARMAGAPLAAMSNSGSGNQGIAATLPVVAVAKRLQSSAEQRLRALAMSHLLAIYIKKLQSPLSALCAATTAAMGSGAAINWLLGGNSEQVEQTIRYMLGDISGIYCDGAKPGCALKVSTGAQTAVKAALLALGGRSPLSDGVLENSVDESLKHLGELTSQALIPTDQAIIGWIAARQN